MNAERESPVVGSELVGARDVGGLVGRLLCKLGRHVYWRDPYWAGEPSTSVLCGEEWTTFPEVEADSPGATLRWHRGDCLRCGW